MKCSVRFLVVAVAMALAVGTTDALAQTIYWNNPASGNWGDPANWEPMTVPNAVGQDVEFNNETAPYAPYTPQSGNHNIDLDGDFTVGSINFNLSNTGANNHRHTIRQSEPEPDVFEGSLTLDETGAGPVQINITAHPNTQGIATITAPVVFNDDVVATIPDFNRGDFAGALRLQGAISGPGGLTRNSGPDLNPGKVDLFSLDAPGASDGAAQNGPSIVTYTGPTILNGGRTRISESRSPVNSSSFTINGNAQLEPTVSGTYSFGAGDLILNSDGTSVSAAGTIRPSRTGTSGLVLTITNDIVLQTTAIIHSKTQGDATAGSITLSGAISGASDAQLQLTTLNDYFQTGDYVLQGANTYAGGTLLRAGQLTVSSGLSSAASLGTGDVTIEGSVGGATPASLVIEGGVLDAIGNSAILSLAGGGAAGADTGFAQLEAGINETVGGLMLGGVAQTMAGTYGSTASGATFQNDEFFAGTGVITLAAAAVEDADFDGDGDIDGADFLTWQRGLGLTGAAATNEAGNADGDSDIDGADLAVWRADFGGAPITANVAAIPEPATALLAAAAASLALLARRRRLG